MSYLGEGGSGRVYLCMDIHDSRLYAVKVRVHACTNKTHACCRNTFWNVAARLAHGRRSQRHAAAPRVPAIHADSFLLV